MPIYEYCCGNCHYQFEALQKMNDAPLEKCDQCGQTQLRKMVSAPSFKLTGSGWYETDFKNKKPAITDSAKDAATATTTTSPITKSEE
jgi:putative FmdB family regulatory protein